MGYNKQWENYTEKYQKLCMENDVIPDSLFKEYGVNRGLRDINGNGVLTGLTNISRIDSFCVKDGKKVPCDGKLWYRGYNVTDWIRNIPKDSLGFGKTAYLLLFGKAPTAEEEKEFKELMGKCRALPTNFTRDVIMKAPSKDIMNSMTRSILTLASYDENATLNKELLKDSLNKIDGINPKVTEVTWDLKVNVDGYEFTITEVGTVTCVGRKEQENLPENNKDNPQDAGKEVALKDSWKIQTARHVKTNDGSEVTEVEKVSTVYAVSVGNGETVPVPYDFYYVGGSIDTGVIISDNEADKYDGKTDKTTHEYATKLKGNQFVWIPCTIDGYTKIDFGMSSASSYDRTTGSSEYAQIQKYGGFYVGRYEAGISTLDETTNTFKDSVTFNNSASLYNPVGIQSGINNWG